MLLPRHSGGNLRSAYFSIPRWEQDAFSLKDEEVVRARKLHAANIKQGPFIAPDGSKSYITRKINTNVPPRQPRLYDPVRREKRACLPGLTPPMYFALCRDDCSPLRSGSSETQLQSSCRHSCRVAACGSYADGCDRMASMCGAKLQGMHGVCAVHGKRLVDINNPRRFSPCMIIRDVDIIIQARPGESSRPFVLPALPLYIALDHDIEEG
jgi:hypothetical protein